MEFKEMDREVRRIFMTYNRALFQAREMHENDADQQLCRKVRFALKQLDEQYAFLLDMEYVQNGRHHWWQDYYARTTYYRIKRKAMDAFLACLK